MGSQKNSARRSLRSKLLVLLLVPLLSLAGLWSFAAYLTTREAIGKYQASTAYHKIAMPGSALTSALQRERAATAVLLGSHGRQGRQEVAASRAATDAARQAFRRSALSSSARRSVNRTTERRLDDAFTALDGLTDVRARVDSRTVALLAAIGDYDAAVDALLRVFGGLIMLNDVGVFQQGQALIDVGTAREFAMREDTLVAAALATRSRRMSAAAHAMFVQSANTGHYLFDTGRANLKPALRDPLDRLAESSGFTAFRALEDSVISARPGAKLPPQTARWRDTAAPLMASWAQASRQAGAALNAEARPIGDRIMLMLYAAAGAGLLAMALSIAVSVRVGRGLGRELIALQRAALDLAEERLPKIVKRLRSGERVDVDTEAPPVEVGGTKEVRKVADAMTTLQRTAVEAAVGEAHLREGINQVFLNLAYRNQSLLQRQLGMLDTMERQATDPDTLQGLLALGHLTTRMRRHAEGLVILSGAPTVRGWHHPVAVRDMLTAAIAEIEDCDRVLVQDVASAALEGSAASDVTHLLAELLENATAFSPPTTQVQVRGELVANGYVVEVEDCGVGMDARELAAANEKVAQAQEFDLADSDRLGLFIVGRLADRHGIRVTLGPSAYGGIRAVVLLPPGVVIGDGTPAPGEPWAIESGRPVPGQATAASVRSFITAPRELTAPAYDSGPAHDGGQVYDGAQVYDAPVYDGGQVYDAPVYDGGQVYDAPVYEGAQVYDGAQTYDNGPVHDGAQVYEAYEDAPAYGTGAAHVPETWAGAGEDTPREEWIDADWADPDAPELPRRVRQASLAPQLRRDDAPPPAATPGGPGTVRSPEETRSLMASLQQGWLRGRQEPEPDE